jgi:sialate O-acetylesterase
LSASGIYNGEVSPLLHFALSGVIWYQGESNSHRAYQYRVVFPLLIQDWRKKWGHGDFPFFFCQLPVYGDKQTKPAESEWAEVRESQAEALKLPNTGEVVLIDQGESDNIHPREKRVAGERLARLALTETYGQRMPDESPAYESMSVLGDKIAIRFMHTDGGLSDHPLPSTYLVNTSRDKAAPLVPDSPGSQLQGFAICGADNRWVWANAKIESDDTVLVWSDQVLFPVAVRYAWADTPTVNLYNGYGLPAAPFRTDSFPAITAKNLFGPGS